jgi:hypothetical protein
VDEFLDGDILERGAISLGKLKHVLHGPPPLVCWFGCAVARLFAKSCQSLPDYLFGAPVLPGAQLLVHDSLLLGVERHRHWGLTSFVLTVRLAAIPVALSAPFCILSTRLLSEAGTLFQDISLRASEEQKAEKGKRKTIKTRTHPHSPVAFPYPLAYNNPSQKHVRRMQPESV